MNALLRKVLGDSFIYAVLPRLSRILSIFMMPVITRYLTPYDYGVTGILFAYIHVFEGFRSLGLDVVFINSFFKDNDRYREIWGKLFGFLTLWAIPYGLILVPIAYLALPVSEKSILGSIVLLVILPVMFFDPTIDLGQRYLQLNRKPFPVSSISLMSALLVLAANYVTIVQYRMGFMGFIVSDTLGKLAAFISYFALLFIRLGFKPRYDISFRWLKQQLAVAIPTIPHAYAGYILNTSDRILLNVFGIPVPTVGLYAFAYSFGTNFSKIGQAMLVAGRPITMALFAEESQAAELKARNMLWVLQAGLLSCGFLLSLWMKEIIALLASNPSLRPSYVYAIPIIMAYTYYPLYIGVINKLYYSEKTGVFWRISFIASVINLGLNILLIPKFGVWGAAITTFVSYLYMGYSGFWLKEFKGINLLRYGENIWLMMTCLLTLGVFLMKDAQLVMKVEITATLLLGWGAYWTLFRSLGVLKAAIVEKLGLHE